MIFCFTFVAVCSYYICNAESTCIPFAVAMCHTSSLNSVRSVLIKKNIEIKQSRQEQMLTQIPPPYLQGFQNLNSV